MKTIGIIGTRRRDNSNDCDLVINALKGIWSRGDRLVSGGCKQGGDRFAEYIAREWIVPITIHLPDKRQLDPELLELNPKAAYAKINYARNALVARDADVLIAVVAPDRKGGTENTIESFVHKLDTNGLIEVPDTWNTKRGYRKLAEAEAIKIKKLVLV